MKIFGVTCLILTVLLCCLGSASAQHRYERRAQAIVDIHRLGGRVIIPHAVIDLHGIRFHNDYLTTLRRFDGVGTLILSGATIAQGQYADIAALPGLTDLSLADTATTDASLTALGTVRGLHSIDLSGTQVTAAGLKNFILANPGVIVRKTR